ncbi:hypothetical protein [Croceicoccus hydrothermalis]|uniref:hypothetical protein n=1 Tax=Croceicoccus hydrothermalis TaxID=2867964 RepID=UPI001EFBE5AA|nr:hypothetical protein [Croceicoccus hydrothermalis]
MVLDRTYGLSHGVGGDPPYTLRRGAGPPFPMASGLSKVPRFAHGTAIPRAVAPSASGRKDTLPKDARANGAPSAGPPPQPVTTPIRRDRDGAAGVPGGPATGPARLWASRWSADGWVLLRESGVAAAGIGASSYGGSQAGAIVRYRLGSSGGRAPRAHARVTTALDGPRQDELALGIGVRPLSPVPVEILAEARIGQFANDTRARPAIVAVAGPPPVSLPLGIEADSYAQAGYVGGRDATAFADGQVRLSREIMQLGSGSVRTGAGAWAGAQSGAARVDIGPTIAAVVPVGPGFARIAVDWRQRVAGDAEPGSGPVLTLSAGF